MIRALRRFVALAVLALSLTFGAVMGWTFLWPMDRVPAPADAIVCLGAGMGPDGTLHAPARTRVAACADLYERGFASAVVFTGGVRTNGGPAAGRQMADLAVTLGVPPEATLPEIQAQSTLQNALFTRDIIGKDHRIILVTEAFHLPRSWASFRWAGFRDIQLYASERVRVAPSGGPSLSILLRETLALWFNAARAGAWSVAGVAGIPRSARDGWLH